MIRLYWYMYYSFKTPKLKSEVIKAYCRIKGLKYTELKIANLKPEDIQGIIELDGNGNVQGLYTGE